MVASTFSPPVGSVKAVCVFPCDPFRIEFSVHAACASLVDETPVELCQNLTLPSAVSPPLHPHPPPPGHLFRRIAADPTADVEGFDVQAKIALLTKLAFGATVPSDLVRRRTTTTGGTWLRWRPGGVRSREGIEKQMMVLGEIAVCLREGGRGLRLFFLELPGCSNMF